jgi:type I restriction enzyme, R subunit
MKPNQNPEQRARDRIDHLLTQCGWVVQDRKSMSLRASLGVAVREYPTDTGPADYMLFIDTEPVGVIEAKREEEAQRLSTAEDQSAEYAQAKIKHVAQKQIPFIYESTGIVTRFTNLRDPKPRSREIFAFQRPETLQKWLKESKTLRARLHDLPALPTDGLRDCQVNAITNLEASFKEARPKALIQMATGSGKTFTAITAIYRLLKFAKAKRILFLVDTKNLGEQAEQEFRRYEPQDDNRLFPELYGVTRLSSAFIPADSQVYISTIQRLYSILKGEELDEGNEEENPNEKGWQPHAPLPVVYSDRIAPEFFDFVVIDECHRSIYNLWRQVLDYFDAFQIGLTATPDNRTFGYFHQNLVSDYGYVEAVKDGVLVPYSVFEIVTKITQQGAVIDMQEMVPARERVTRRTTWQTLDEDHEYTGRHLDESVLNMSQIRLILQRVRANLPALFPDRYKDGLFEVPKMLIFAKSDSHAEDIVHTVRDVFAEENKFCKKITYKSKEDGDPKAILQQFRNEYYPRIAVTVDMIATGTDIRPLEVLLFMRDVRSRSYYEQMKGRGTRTCGLEELQTTGTPAAKFTKDHFVIIDAIGVERSQKTDSRPLERKPSISLKDLMEAVQLGHHDEEVLSSLANRLIRLHGLMTEPEKSGFAERSGGKTMRQVIGQLIDAHDPDKLEALENQVRVELAGADAETVQEEIQARHKAILREATSPFDQPEVRDYVLAVRKKYDQLIDEVNLDEVLSEGWVAENATQAQATVDEFQAWIADNRDQITALQIFYDQPYRRRELSYQMIEELAATLRLHKPTLAPLTVWRAYERLEKVSGQPQNELVALVALIRRAVGIDATLTAYDQTVARNFQTWVFAKQAGAVKFTEAQMEWLRMIRDYIAGSFHIDREDFDLSPFNAAGGLGKFWSLFGGEMDGIIGEMNEVLAA